jgi:hypothetical protein
MCLRLLQFPCLPSECRGEGLAWNGELRWEQHSRCSPRCSLRRLYLHLLLRVAAGLGGWCIPFLGALLVQVTAPAPQAARRLLAVCPDLAELLAVLALRKTILSSRCSYRLRPLVSFFFRSFVGRACKFFLRAFTGLAWRCQGKSINEHTV